MLESQKADVQVIKNGVEPAWFALQVRSRSEKKVLQFLTKEGFDVYLPLLSTIKQWSDRKKKVQLPLISSIVFIRINPVLLYTSCQHPSVFGPIKYLGRPATVRTEEIENLRILASSGFLSDWKETSRIERGEKVRLNEGPFAGLEGVFVGEKANNRIAVNLDSLGKSIVVELPATFVSLLQ
jgi:transcription antitermination factor NusG